MKEVVVVSGKGGTGKTSLSAAFAVLARNAVVADCDVDAADLHLLLEPRVLEEHEFYSGHEAVIRSRDCVACGVCESVCRFDAVRVEPSETGLDVYSVDPLSCEGCGVCVRFCPEEAIDFPERHAGRWMVSETRAGLMVHAHLFPSAENSGKLVSVVRKEAKRIAEREGAGLLVVDGPPGVGCPVISSITGADLVVVVAEPTVSGEHDLKRVLDLANHFRIPARVVVNRWDLNVEATRAVEDLAAQSGAGLLGRVRYDPGVTAAQVERRTVVEVESPAAQDVRAIWERILEALSVPS